MDETKLCKIYYVSSTVFYPIVFIAIFFGFLWASILLLFSLFVAVIKTHFDKIKDVIKIKAIKVTLQFLIFNCIFGIWYLANYLYNKSDSYETNFLFNVSWSLLFALVSIFFIGINWEIYLLVLIFIGILQSMMDVEINNSNNP